MKKWVVALLLMTYSYYTYAQKIDVQKWVKHNIDSLHRKHIDTAIYFNEYCDECDAKAIGSQCSTFGYDVEIENVIIYKQKDKFYSVTFNCNNPSVVKQLDSCKSIPYSISIIPILGARDKAIKFLYKQGKFLPPGIMDGINVYAKIYLGKMTNGLYMSKDMSGDLYKAWQNYFWFDKQVMLFKLIYSDINN